MRRLVHRNGLQPLIAPHAMLDVHDEIALRHRSCLGDHRRRRLSLSWTRQLVAKHVLLGDDDEIIVLEARLNRDLRNRHLPLGHFGPGLHRLRIRNPVVVQNADQPARRSHAPRRDDHLLVGRLPLADVPHNRIEQVGVRVRALQHEAPSRLRAPHQPLDLPRRLLRCVLRRERNSRVALQRLAQLRRRQIQPLRWQNMLRQPARLRRAAPNFEILFRLRDPLACRLCRLRIKPDQSLVAHIVENRLQLLVEQGQPLLHALPANALARRLVCRVAPGRTKRRQEIPSQERKRIIREIDLAHRREHDLLQLHRRALRLRIEVFRALQLVAKEVEPYRLRHARRKDVDDAPAH